MKNSRPALPFASAELQGLRHPDISCQFQGDGNHRRHPSSLTVTTTVKGMAWKLFLCGMNLDEMLMSPPPHPWHRSRLLRGGRVRARLGGGDGAQLPPEPFFSRGNYLGFFFPFII